jgi:hypothetical protein
MESKIEKQDSIKVSRNAKGTHAYEIKLYFDSSVTDAEAVIDSLKHTEDRLLEVFEDVQG